LEEIDMDCCLSLAGVTGFVPNWVSCRRVFFLAFIGKINFIFGANFYADPDPGAGANPYF
jgi:hypothetical protein